MVISFSSTSFTCVVVIWAGLVWSYEDAVSIHTLAGFHTGLLSSWLRRSSEWELYMLLWPEQQHPIDRIHNVWWAWFDFHPTLYLYLSSCDYIADAPLWWSCVFGVWSSFTGSGLSILWSRVYWEETTAAACLGWWLMSNIFTYTKMFTFISTKIKRHNLLVFFFLFTPVVVVVFGKYLGLLVFVK